jgi:hypothetical protein
MNAEGKTMRFRYQLLIFATAAGLAAATGAAQAGPVSDTLYFTNFDTHEIQSTTGSYNGNGTTGNGTFTLTAPNVIATTPGADGIVRNPNDGNLLIGGQGNAVYSVDPTTTNSFFSKTPNVNAYHLAVDPTGNVVYATGIPGNLASLPINPHLSGSGTVISLTGDNTQITSLAFTPGGTVFYTASGGGGGGDFGTVDLGTGVTTAILHNLPAAHGMVYDPFTGDLILGGSDEFAQIDPLNPSVVMSSELFPGNTFDQGAVDGLGHIFWADNGGNFFFEDYSTTNLVGAATNFVSDNFFQASLDDVAPLIGAGGTNTDVPEPASLAMLSMGLLGLRVLRRRRAG